MIQTVDEGGLEVVRGANGSVVISDMAFIGNLPFNLRAIDERHKKVCGCDISTI